MRTTGVGLLVTAYAVLLYTSLAAPAYARAHPHLDAAMLAAYSAPWPVALACALVPIRRREHWAMWTSFAMWIILFVTRMAADPRCLVVLDPHQHGCHTFMIAVVLGIIGLGLAAFGPSRGQTT